MNYWGVAEISHSVHDIVTRHCCQKYHGLRIGVFVFNQVKNDVNERERSHQNSAGFLFPS